MPKEPKHLGTLASGESVYERPRSHMLLHDNGKLGALLKETFPRVESGGRGFIVESVDFGETIGKTNCVETVPGDDIRFAIRKGRKGRTRFVVGKEDVPTSLLTFVLMKVPQGYILITAYFGPRVPREPWDPHAEPESEAFWQTHALTWKPGETEA